MDASLRFLDILTKGNHLCDFLFASLDEGNFQQNDNNATLIRGSLIWIYIVNLHTSCIHVIPPWSSWRPQEMSHKILLKYITFYQNFEISRKWMKNILIYSIHFSKTSRKWKKSLPDTILKFITCMLLFKYFGLPSTAALLTKILSNILSSSLHQKCRTARQNGQIFILSCKNV